MKVISLTSCFLNFLYGPAKGFDHTNKNLGFHLFDPRVTQIPPACTYSPNLHTRGDQIKDRCGRGEQHLKNLKKEKVTMRTSQRLTLGAVLISGMSLMAYPAAAASFQTFTSVNSNLPDHFFPYLIGLGSQIPPAPATAEQATITAPLEAPAGDWTYAWLMSTDLQTWTQVGLAWAPGAAGPYIFSDSSTLSPDYVEGPSIPPGGSVTVRVFLQGSENVAPQPSTWVTEYWSTSGWQVLQTARVTGELTPPTVEEYYSGNVARQNWLFRWVGYFDGAWHHMAASAQGSGAPA